MIPKDFLKITHNEYARFSFTFRYSQQVKKLHDFCIFADFDRVNFYWMQKLCEDSQIPQYESCIMGIVKVTSQK